MNAPTEYYEKRTVDTVTFPASGATDLADPITRRTVVPARVQLELTRIVTPDRAREFAYVHVSGPRRLKSGEKGCEISSFGWEDVYLESSRGYMPRPDWLTELLAEHLPDGWSRTLLGLNGGTR